MPARHKAEERLERSIIRRDFDASFMSDTKWRKLFAALDRPDLELTQCIVKFVDVEREHRIAAPRSIALHPPRPYVDTPEFGPVTLRSIEWLEFPALAEWPQRDHVPARIVPQDIERARTIIEALGRYPVEETKRGIRIVGHQRRRSST
ncbi:MAG: DUF6678 family protein [Alphaproteobacteria bacterium]